eukprot:TRINITY_DN1394_c0_g2_i3.p1 TRINITY_DN1394_c0_g2~~TRINITY_DN1394_c0_g2_i3.p1  ORF type:complete len:183 (+),score=3.69 TRINITY_DN1394_c0_g2_i3:39-587(+)
MLCVRVARCAVSAHARSPAAIDRGLCRPGTRRFATSKVREIAEDAAGFLVLVSTVGLVVGGGLYALHSLFHPGDTTMRLKKGNQVLHIIGTCHTSPESPTNVAALIPFVKVRLSIHMSIYWYVKLQACCWSMLTATAIRPDMLMRHFDTPQLLALACLRCLCSLEIDVYIQCFHYIQTSRCY